MLWNNLHHRTHFGPIPVVPSPKSRASLSVTVGGHFNILETECAHL
jgi:hypothetical protein